MLLLIRNYPIPEQKHNLENIKLGDIDETNAFTYQNTEIKLGNYRPPAVRTDLLSFDRWRMVSTHL
jgi:hypothetical protein